MKRYIFLTAVLLISVQTMSAQTITDALNLSTRYYDGTARSLGMGNAMTALGGDLGALSYNPAASGLYRYSEITLTPSLSGFTGQTSYSGNTAHNSRMRLSLSNIGWVSGIETGRRNGLVSVNFAIATNQTNNFVYRTSASGVEAQTSFLASLAANIPDGVTGGDLTMPEDYPESPFMRGVASWSAILGWNAGLIDTLAGFDGFLGATENVVADDKGNVWVGVPGDLNQKYYKERSGYVQDVVFNASANISNRFFFGLNLTLQSIWMSEYSSYSEYAADPSLFQTGFENVTSEYLYNISGMGVKVDAGFIAHPVAGLTVGASVSTPTWMFLNDSYEEKMSGYTKDYGSNSLSYSTTGSFRLMSPFRFNVGVGYTFGSYLALGVDYERADYGMMTGPIETYDDMFRETKASYESFILLKDEARSKDLAKFVAMLPALQKELPCAPEYKTFVPGTSSDLNVYDAVFYAGDCNAGSKTIAINLPNDERVHALKGTRRLQLRNSMKAKFDKILLPIGQLVVTPEQQKYLNFDAFFWNVTFHEVAHGLGVKQTIRTNESVDAVMGTEKTSWEEAKADILGLFMVTKLIEMGEITNITAEDAMATYIAGILRSVRFGAASSHGKANMMCFNYMEKAGAFSRDDKGQYVIDFAKAKEAMNGWAALILQTQGDGNVEFAKKYREENGGITPALQADLDRINGAGIPRDITFVQGEEVLFGKAQ